MSSPREFELLADLARLLKKYGPGAFERLAKELSKPELAKSMAAVLASAAKISQIRDTKTKPEEIQDSIRALQDVDPEKAEALDRLYEALRRKSILPHLRDVKRFALENGLVSSRLKSREESVAYLMRAFMGMPLSDLKSVLDRARLSGNLDDRSLESWSKVIFEER